MIGCIDTTKKGNSHYLYRWMVKEDSSGRQGMLGFGDRVWDGGKDLDGTDVDSDLGSIFYWPCELVHGT